MRNRPELRIAPRFPDFAFLDVSPALGNPIATTGDGEQARPCDFPCARFLVAEQSAAAGEIEMGSLSIWHFRGGEDVGALAGFTRT
jgi:hypothetical protein